MVLDAYLLVCTYMEKIYQRKTLIAVAIIAVVVLGGFWIFRKSATTQNYLGKAVDTVNHAIVPEQPFNYIEIIDGCGPYYDTGTCVNVRSGPGTEHQAVARLRTGVVLRVDNNIKIPDDKPEGTNGRQWYKIVFENNIRYPERVSGGWYVAVDPTSVRPFSDGSEGEITSTGNNLTASAGSPKPTKRIVVDVSDQLLYAYDGDTLFMKEPVSTGLELTHTPVGTFSIYKKTPSRYMQGPLPGVSDQVYDLPGVPWDLYFTEGGAVIHGAYWHDHFGEPWSHGCVNLPSAQAQKLYQWAPLGTPVTIQP